MIRGRGGGADARIRGRASARTGETHDSRHFIVWRALRCSRVILCMRPARPLRKSSRPTPEYLAAAIADPDRPAADGERDANRKPAETLEFAGVKPGDQGRRAPAGRRLFHPHHQQGRRQRRPRICAGAGAAPDAPADTPDFAARVKALAADPSYSNVSVVVEPFSQLKTPEPVDLVWTSQNYHDLHNFPGLDLAVFNQMVFEALKPGRHLSHLGSCGGARRRARATPRRCIGSIRKTVKREVLAAGFVFVGAAICCAARRSAHREGVRSRDPRQDRSVHIEIS